MRVSGGEWDKSRLSIHVLGKLAIAHEEQGPKRSKHRRSNGHCTPPHTIVDSAMGDVVFFEEIHSDDEGPEREHNGEVVEQLAPFELPVHTLTADMVEAHKAKEAAAVNAPQTVAEEAEALRLRGNAAFGAKRFDEAAELYGEAIACDGQNGALFGNRAAALLQLGRVQPALKDAREMVRLMPDTPKAHFRLGSALSASNQPADAARAFVAALHLEPGNAAVAEALRKEVGRPALSKKGKQQHAALLQECQKALVDADAARAQATPHPPPPPPPPTSGRRARWHELQAARGSRPPRRGGASLTAAAGRLWLIGGADRTGNVYSDVWEYVPSPSESAEISDSVAAAGPAAGTATAVASEGGAPVGWRAQELAGEINMRSGHAAVALAASPLEGCSASILVFGGQDPRSSVLLADLRVLHIPARAGIDATWSAGALTPLGTPPEARNGHSLASDAASSTLWLFGGADADGHLNDLHRLTLPRWASPRESDGAAVAERPAGEAGEEATWDSPACTGKPPAAREMHVAAVLPERHQLLIHGGRSNETLLDDLHLLALDTLVWAASITTPCRRVGHAAALVPSATPSTSSKLLLFGGFSGEQFNNDTWSVATGSAASTVDMEELPAKEAPAARFAHCAAALGGRLVVFGGSAAEGELDDLFQLH